MGILRELAWLAFLGMEGFCPVESIIHHILVVCTIIFQGFTVGSLEGPFKLLNAGAGMVGSSGSFEGFRGRLEGSGPYRLVGGGRPDGLSLRVLGRDGVSAKAMRPKNTTITSAEATKLQIT